MANHINITPFGAVPNDNQLRHYHIGKKAFFHYGINTYTGAEWGNGSENLSLFNPSSVDVRGWIRSIKAAGFGLAILTAKHHDGFCLWPSAHSTHTIRETPYQDGHGDLVREFTDACREYGVLAGIYLSPWDRHSPLWGTDAYSDEYAAQLTELMTDYGRIDEVWWDGAGSNETEYRWDEWADIIHRLQPHAAIFGSMSAAPYIDLRWVGNERGQADETHYAVICEDSVYREDTDALFTGMHGGNRYIPSECDVSIRPAWFYKASQDDQVKSVAALNRLWFESIGRNSMMLLSFPPNKEGRLHEKDVQNAVASHRCIQSMLAINYAADAVCTADSVLDEAHTPDKAVLDDDSLFYAAATADTCVTLDLQLPSPQKLNVLCLGEVVEYGERITGFTLEAVGENAAIPLARGTSVGFYRAIQFPEGEYTHLRLTITEASAAPILRTLSLHRYESIPDESLTTFDNIDLAAQATATVTYSEDDTCAVVAFGGIYPFNYINASLQQAGTYILDCFDGLSYHTIAAASTNENGRLRVMLDSIHEGSYQIRLRTSAPIRRAVGIVVKKKV